MRSLRNCVPSQVPVSSHKFYEEALVRVFDPVLVPVDEWHAPEIERTEREVGTNRKYISEWVYRFLSLARRRRHKTQRGLTPMR